MIDGFDGWGSEPTYEGLKLPITACATSSRTQFGAYL